MKEKTHNFFKDLIEDLPVSFENGPWIAGGFPLSVYRGDKLFAHDIDFFFKDEQQFEVYISLFDKHFVKRNTKEVKGDIINPCSEIFLTNRVSRVDTENAVTFIPSDVIGEESVTVQFIKKSFYDDIEAVLDDFDISVCKIATDGVEFLASDRTYDHIDNSIFEIDLIHEKSIKRFTKYVQYGFTPTEKTIQRIFEHKDFITDFTGIDDY